MVFKSRFCLLTDISMDENGLHKQFVNYLKIYHWLTVRLLLHTHLLLILSKLMWLAFMCWCRIVLARNALWQLVSDAILDLIKTQENVFKLHLFGKQAILLCIKRCRAVRLCAESTRATHLERCMSWSKQRKYKIKLEMPHLIGGDISEDILACLIYELL